MNHASSNHPWAVNYLQQISDCSLDSVKFPTLKKDLILKQEENYFIEDTDYFTENTDYISIKEEPLETTYLTEENYGANYLVFGSSRSVKMREFSSLSFYTF